MTPTEGGDPLPARRWLPAGELTTHSPAGHSPLLATSCLHYPSIAHYEIRTENISTALDFVEPRLRGVEFGTCCLCESSFLLDIYPVESPIDSVGQHGPGCFARSQLSCSAEIGIIIGGVCVPSRWKDPRVACCSAATERAEGAVSATVMILRSGLRGGRLCEPLERHSCAVLAHERAQRLPRPHHSPLPSCNPATPTHTCVMLA